MSSSYPIVALWAVPRSVSTAFERMIAARGDFAIFNEPFSSGYYFGPDRPNDRFPAEPPSDEHDPEKVVAKLHDAAKNGPVFFKDMAYHVRRFLDWELIEPFRNSILIRDPRLALTSLHKKMPDFTREETGYESLAELVNLVRDKTGTVPLVMDGEVLRSDPARVSRQFCEAVDIPFAPEALQWEKGDEEHWDQWKEWFVEAAQSEGFSPPAVIPDEEQLREPAIAAALKYCSPCYETLSSYCAP